MPGLYSIPCDCGKVYIGHIKLRWWGITQRKEYNIQNMVKVWNQEASAFFQFCLNSEYSISFCTNRKWWLAWYLNLMFNYRLKYESLWTSYDTASSSDIICRNRVPNLWNLKSLGCYKTIQLSMFLANPAL
jgi:hypothetical protein